MPSLGHLRAEGMEPLWSPVVATSGKSHPCGVHKLGPGVDLPDLQADRVYEPDEIMGS
jgi:hypothetical protein